MIGYGGEDILKGAIHCFLTQENNNRKIMIPTYSWWYYKSIADEVNGKTIMYPLYEDGYDFKYNIPEIKKIAKEEKPGIALFASPNNPTGNTLTLDEIHDIVSSLDKDTVVIMDEAYTLFNNKDLKYISGLPKEFPNLLIIRTFSKFFGLPGLRLGYAFMGDGLQKFAGFSTMYLGYNKLSEKLGIAALKSMDYYNANAEKMQEGKELYKTLNAIPGIKVYNSHANFVLVKYPEEAKEKLREAFAQENLVVKFMNEEGLQSHMRITLASPEMNGKVVEIIKKSHPGMKAILLAAGIASRLRPLTDHTPKCLLDIGSKNLLARTLDALILNGIEDIIIVTGYLHVLIEDYIRKNYPELKVTFIHNDKYASTNNIYSLWMTKEEAKDQDILLLDSDILFDPQIISILLASPHSNCLALNKHDLGEEEIKIIADDLGK